MPQITTRETPRAAMARVFGASLLALAVLLGAKAATAAGPTAPVCASYEAISKQLEKKYTEVPVGRGLVDGNKLMQLFASADGATWTVVVVRADGVSCIAAAGEHWQDVAPKALGPEA